AAGTSNRVLRRRAGGGAVGIRRLDRNHVRGERSDRSGAQSAALDRALHHHRHGALLSRHRVVRLRPLAGQDGGLVARRLRCGAGHAGRRRCRARGGRDHDRDHRVEQRHRAHGGADTLRDGAGRLAAAPARGCPSAVPHPGAVARRARHHRDRAHVDLHGAVVEGHVQPAVHLRRVGRIHLLWDVGRRSDPAPTHRGRYAPPLPHVGLSRDAVLVRAVFRVAHLEHRARAAARLRRRHGADSRGLAVVLVAEGVICHPSSVIRQRQRRITDHGQRTTSYSSSVPGFCRRCNAPSTSFLVSGYLRVPAAPCSRGVPSWRGSVNWNASTTQRRTALRSSFRWTASTSSAWALPRAARAARTCAAKWSVASSDSTRGMAPVSPICAMRRYAASWTTSWYEGVASPQAMALSLAVESARTNAVSAAARTSWLGSSWNVVRARSAARAPPSWPSAATAARRTCAEVSRSAA